MSTRHKWGDDVRVGDVLDVFGTRTVTRIDAYGPSNIDCVDERWRIMRSGDFGMALDPDAGWELDDRGVWTVSHRRRCRPCDGHHWMPDGRACRDCNPDGDIDHAP